ncbi:hypothetical protein L6452_36972 [Arctium lappa]|uniref:Uncharacterized protein n=1 Tax=Arctium lappa TaxID=4217 RepID=A0ACB8Y1N7_ARCLA|nr:hypothetical protein L6452_36972 [Arctium lappa]
MIWDKKTFKGDPRDQKDRLELWGKLERLCEKEEVWWVLFGDFNEVRNEQERFNSVVNEKGMEDFNEFIRRITSEFGALWRNLGAKVLERKWSDHAPIMLSDQVYDFGPRPFKFFDAWIKDESLEEVVREAWSKEGDIEKDLDSKREAVKNWEEEVDGNRLSLEDRQRWVEGRKKWLELEIKISKMARQKAKDPKTIKDIVRKFFKDKFSSQKGDRPQLRSNSVKKLTVEDACSIERRISEEEVWNAVRNCGANKSPMRRKGMIFKVDFEKAYDTVYWQFLLDMIKEMGFGEKWRGWIKTCLGSSKVFVLVNGAPSQEFQMERGLRQGYPLAIFLFLIVAEGLHMMMEEATTKGIF